MVEQQQAFMGTSGFHKVGHVRKQADEHALASVKVLQEAGNVPVKLLLLMNCSNRAALLKAIKQSLIVLIVSHVCTKPHAGPLQGLPPQHSGICVSKNKSTIAIADDVRWSLRQL